MFKEMSGSPAFPDSHAVNILQLHALTTIRVMLMVVSDAGVNQDVSNYSLMNLNYR